MEKTREVAEGGDPNASTSRTRIGIAVPAPRVQSPRPVVDESGASGRSQTKITVMLGRHSAGRHAAAIRLEPGQQVPSTPYRIVRWLGDGGMGVVYEAEHVALERRVALKVLRPEATGSVAETRMFRQEARTVSKIGSEHIVEVFDLGELPDGRVWFAMELLGGTSLELLAKEGPFEPSRAIAILRQVCKGLAAAHAIGVVHRDVKPGNISVQTRRGRADAVKILDFGVSALISEVAQGGVVLAGTPAYMAPELACGLPYDARVDLYALGCTAYEMFAGHPPFVGSDVDEVLLAHVEREPTPIAEASRVPIPPPLAAVIMRCLAKHADDRYADAADVEAALCEAQVEAGIHTSWDDLELPEVDPKRREALLRRMPEPGRTEAPRKRRVMAFLLAALVASSFVLGAMLWPDRRSIPEDLDLIERLTIAARASAAKSWFVYPPASSPDERTAFRTIVELESVEGDAAAEARARAALLREEFSTTLMRLGDRYWEREGGRPFAVDYYAAALIFDPTLEAARERVSLTPGELADLREKAQSQSFSPAELRATDALAALAEEDPEERRRKLEALENDEERSAVSGTRLARLIAEDTGPKSQPRSKRSRSRESASDDGESRALGQAAPQDAREEPADPRQGEEQDVARTDRAVDLPATSKRDPEAARALVEQGDAALKRGNVSEARRFYERALAADARHAAAFYGSSRASFHAGDYAEAARLGEKAVRARPNASEYRIHLGDAYYKAFRYADAQLGGQQALRGRNLAVRVWRDPRRLGIVGSGQPIATHTPGPA